MITTRIPTRTASLAASRPATRSTVALSSRAALVHSRFETALVSTASPAQHASNAPSRKTVTMMGNKATTGPFAPLVVVTRSALGEKPFNQLRGKAISLHSQVIKDVLNGVIGVDNKQVQGVIRLAKKNGEWLGFLA